VLDLQSHSQLRPRNADAVEPLCARLREQPPRGALHQLRTEPGRSRDHFGIADHRPYDVRRVAFTPARRTGQIGIGECHLVEWQGEAYRATTVGPQADRL